MHERREYILCVLIEKAKRICIHVFSYRKRREYILCILIHGEYMREENTSYVFSQRKRRKCVFMYSHTQRIHDRREYILCILIEENKRIHSMCSHTQRIHERILARIHETYTV